MTLRYLPGVEEMTEAARRFLMTGATAVDTVEDFELEERVIEEEEDDDNGDPLLEIDSFLIDDIAVVVADVIIKNMDNREELEETEPEKVAFFCEQIVDSIQDALLTCDLTKDSYEMWTSANLNIY